MVFYLAGKRAAEVANPVKPVAVEKAKSVIVTPERTSLLLTNLNGE